MPNVEVTTVLAALEFVVSVMALVIFYLRGWHKYYKAMAVYLTFRILSGLALTPFLAQHVHRTTTGIYSMSMVVFWISYFISVAIIFAVYIEILKAIFPVLKRMSVGGNLGLLWMLSFFVIVLLVVSIPSMGTGHFFSDFMHNVMQAVCILEMFMLAFLLIGMRTFRISVRDVNFGIALGFAVLAMTNLLHSVSSLQSYFGVERLANLYHAVSMTSLLIWSLYALQPAKRREPVLLPLKTMLQRWNEIASAMGHKETKVLMPRQAGFFLQDVEKIVDRAFEENFK